MSPRPRTPEQVQAFLRRMPYNREKRGETLRSAEAALAKGTAHCLEAAFVAAYLLEPHGYPPLVMSLESKDDLDHVIFVYRHPRTGLWGSVARSRDDGLHGRRAAYRRLRDLAWSYFDPYVDATGRITGYGLANLDDSKADWRRSPKGVWKAERYLIDLEHRPLRAAESRYRRALAAYRRHGAPARGKNWL